MTDRYANKLETWFAGLPSLVQEVLHEPFSWMNDGLKSVSGDPQALVAAAPGYVRIADAVVAIGSQQRADRDTLGGLWADDAFSAFSARIDEIDQQILQLADGVRQVTGLLEQGAQACVEGADMIVDLVTSLIMFALSLIAVNVALSIVTLGTSLAAGVAAVVARAATTLAKVARVVEKVAQVLTRLANTFRRIEAVLKRVVELLKKLETYLKTAKAQAKAAKGMDGIRKNAIFTAQNTAVSEAIKIGTFGAVAPPGAGGAAFGAGRNYVEGVVAANRARDEVQ